jgi:hypothetical protein
MPAEKQGKGLFVVKGHRFCTKTENRQKRAARIKVVIIREER